MGKKHDFLSPKAIANRIKARGLQKLRWYCQLCQKQCRDENGFKCHQTSEGHRRQLELFGQNPGKAIGQYSYQFESDFMAHMRVCHPTAKVSANKVYNEFIRDKNHVHMNSTRWLSLSGFVQYLGKKGLCKIEQSPKGWFMQLIPKDDATDVKRNKRKERDEAEKEDDIRQMKEIEQQIKKAGKTNETEDYDNDQDGNDRSTWLGSELQRDDMDEPISFAMQKQILSVPCLPNKWKTVNQKTQHLSVFEIEESEEIKEEEEEQEVPDPVFPKGWIRTDIIVKVLSPSLKEHGYYKQKGVIQKVIDNFVAEIKMLNSGDIIRVDQAELETVLPAVGGKVIVLTGLQQDSIGEVLGLNIEQCKINVKLKDREDWFDYESVCKLYDQNNYAIH